MTREQKDLLINDLSGRLSHGVKCKILETNEIKILGSIQYDGENTLFDFWEDDQKIQYGYQLYLSEFKPYLFPLSSMTEEQKQEYTYIVNYISSDDTENWKEGEFIYVEQFTQLMHFYHINHLDYMGLIPMGLANDATGLNIY
jgi:hypothetical protein